MNRKASKTLVWLIFFIKSTSSLPSLDDIDSALKKISEDTIYAQTGLVKRLTDTSALIQSCSDQLKSQSLVPKLQPYLDNLAVLMKQYKTMDYFEAYQQVSTCNDVNYKITMMEFDVKKFSEIIAKTNFNVSQFYPNYNLANYYYTVNLNALGSLATNVSDILKKTVALYTEFARFNQILATGIAITTINKIILNAYKRQYCACLSKVSWTGYNSTLGKNLQLIEDKLIALQTTITNVTSDDLKLITTSLSSTSTAMKTALQALQTILNNIATISDYAAINWSNVPNCNDLYNRITYLKHKQWQYTTVFQSASFNRSLVVSARVKFNVTSTKDLSASQLLAIQNVVNYTMKLEAQYTKYVSQLIFSIQKVASMIGDISGVGDTYCSCDLPTTASSQTTTVTTTKVATTSKASTTTTTTTEEPTTTEETTTTENPTTTTTILTTFAPNPCGTFVKYDTVNNLNGPTLGGFAAGTFSDGTTVYIGYGNNSACFNEVTCPARITTSPDKPGAFSTCFDNLDEIYDNGDAYYLLNNANLAFVPANATTMFNIPGTLNITTGGYQFLFGRVNYLNYTTTCKIVIDSKGNGANGCYYYTPSQEVSVDADFDVIVCK